MEDRPADAEGGIELRLKPDPRQPHQSRAGQPARGLGVGELQERLCDGSTGRHFFLSPFSTEAIRLNKIQPSNPQGVVIYRRSVDNKHKMLRTSNMRLDRLNVLSVATVVPVEAAGPDPPGALSPRSAYNPNPCYKYIAS